MSTTKSPSSRIPDLIDQIVVDWAKELIAIRTLLSVEGKVEAALTGTDVNAKDLVRRRDTISKNLLKIENSRTSALLRGIALRACFPTREEFLDVLAEVSGQPSIPQLPPKIPEK